MARPELGALLNAASSGLSTLGDRVLKPLDVTSAQWKVFVVLARRGDCRVSDLVRVLEHDQAAVSRLVARMERAGLVRRKDDPLDARVGVVSLSPLGRKTFQRCDDTLRVVMAAVERPVEAGERAELRRLLSKLAAGVDAALEQHAVRPRRRRAQGVKDIV